MRRISSWEINMSKLRLLASVCAIVLLGAAEGSAQSNTSKNQPPGGAKPGATAPRQQPSAAQRTARARCMNFADANARNRCLNGLSSTPPPATPQ
jgi:hypothetical protein